MIEKIILKQKLSQLLPGSVAHETMRAIPVGDLIPKFEHKLPPKPGSVLILLYQEAGRILFPLIKRQDYNGAHSGQISLPGGKAEIGEDSYQTALREANEEIGVIAEEIEVLGKLSDFFVIPSNFMITPVVAVMDKTPNFIPDPREVYRIIKADLKDLLSEDAIKNSEILAANRYRMKAPHFEIDGEIVWGATAMILNELRIILKST